ncbi:LamG-like jellyroll fold domain-containing protein [Flavobacterium sp. DSP2-3-1]|uniref:LamG-like jellyroll fold domain-containing protein n=1 Tax=Flavobacterium sp. DSP2-3-1 TaxID=2804620 RepID=UPI003CECED4B
MKKTTLFTKKYTLSLFIFLSSFIANSQTQSRTFTSTGTFTVPSGVSKVTVQLWGGGGAGGGCTNINFATGGGGGGGNYNKIVDVTVTALAVINVTVGLGGTGVSGANGNAGGDSLFGLTAVARGGNGGNVNTGSSPINGSGATTTSVSHTYIGGAGGTGNATTTVVGTSGGGGGGAGYRSAGNPASAGTAGLGGSYGGGNGASGRNSNTGGNGNAATALSGGGGGGQNGNSGSTIRTGGNGFRGQVTVTWVADAFFDSDGDGFRDNVDIDDDNDGILDTTECPDFVKPRLLNADFEDRDITKSPALDTFGSPGTTDQTQTKGVWRGDASNIPDWQSAAPNNQLEIWHKSQEATNDVGGTAFSGIQWAEINALGNEGFYQDIVTTPGDILQWSFAHRKRSGYAGSAVEDVMQLLIGPAGPPKSIINLISQGDFVSAANASWTEYTGRYLVPSGQTLTRLTFTVLGTASGSNGTGNFMDKVQLFVVPICGDTDGDSIPNYFDLDSDNDGIPDVIEAGLGNLSNGKGKIDVSWVDANGDGLHDSAAPSAALLPLNSDGDTVANYLDLDSDNDSLFDVDESGAGNSSIGAVTGYVNGDGDIKGDGRGEGVDSEKIRNKDNNGDGIYEGFGDGILDIFDYSTGVYGNLNQGTANLTYPAATYLKDSDGNGIPDYLDLKANGTIWDITSNKLIYLPKDIDTNNDGIIGAAGYNTDLDNDGILDAFDTNTSYFGSPRDLERKLFIEFDGRNDYGQDISVINGLPNATLMAWINLNSLYSAEGIIVGQDKFQLKVNGTKTLQAVTGATTIAAPIALNTMQWIHVAVVYDSSNSLLKLYVNGTMINSAAISGALPADNSLLTIGKNPSANDRFFKGSIDEIRVFDTALTDSQLQKMVYQEIKANVGQIRGEIIPKDITGLPWANLKRYYKMDNFKDNVIDNHTTAAIDVTTGAKIYNVKNLKIQQAPMPFITQQTGDVATAVGSTLDQIRGQDAVDSRFSIIVVKHDVNTTSDLTNLGMIVNADKKITIGNDFKLQNDWYLKLDGKIDLQGKSQLLQTIESDLETTITGSIERDQQGQSNKYNFNYWSSPVSPINQATINNNYTVNGVMKDGFNTIPRNINWVSGYDGASGNAGTPISLARYWLYKFESNTEAYANWIQITETTPLRAGQGYTLKGSGAVTNFTFVGKPNNGLVDSNTISADQLLLVGNPYPSAIDARKFISDNINSVDRLQDVGVDGTLYFWEHSSDNNSHVLSNYLGGFAVLNLSGGVAAVAPSGISGKGLSTKIPKWYIPVGQGFFVYGKTDSGLNNKVVFNNGQRIFAKEDNPESNTLFKINPNVKNSKKLTENESDPTINDTFKRIRLGFDSNNNYHRQVLLAFMDDKATSGIDDGYDGYINDDFPNDMYLLNREEQLVIEGEGFFDANASYPIGVKTDTVGKVKFMIDSSENFDKEQAFYIYDDMTGLYHNIRNEAFETNLTKGENKTRFSLRFTDKTLRIADNTINNNDITAYLKNSNTLLINNNILDAMVKEVSLFNTIGQSITSWKIENQEQHNIQLPIKKISAGVYIAKIQTTKGNFSKKIIIHN